MTHEEESQQHEHVPSAPEHDNADSVAEETASNASENADASEPQLTAEEERDQFRDKYVRAIADLENLRKRNQKDRMDMLRYAAERPLGEIFPIFDNLERAVQHASADPATIVEGVKMILNMADQALERMGVSTVGKTGEKFDPNLHDALQQMASDTIESGHVITVFERGYRLHDRLLRPAKVVVSTGPAQQTGNAASDLESAAADLENWDPSDD